VAVPRHETHLATTHEREGAEAVELQLVEPRGIIERLAAADERHGAEALHAAGVAPALSRDKERERTA